MNRKFLLFCVLILILGITLMAGCGGGGNDNPIEKGPSIDYMGLQVGAVLKYDVSGIDDEGTHHTNLTFYHRVLDYTYIGNPIENDPLFKTEEEFVGFSPDGNYISKTVDGTNKYFYRGYWNNSGTDEHRDLLTDTYLWIENPPKSGIEYEWGFLSGTELVSVPAGYFKALKFVDSTLDEGILNIYTVWFVPYLGIVKYTELAKNNTTNEFISDLKEELREYSF